jgi:hypothetical protein
MTVTARPQAAIAATGVVPAGAAGRMWLRQLASVFAQCAQAPPWLVVPGLPCWGAQAGWCPAGADRGRAEAGVTVPGARA